MTTTRTAEERAAELVRRYDRTADARGWGAVSDEAAEVLRGLAAEMVSDLVAEIDRHRRGGV